MSTIAKIDQSERRFVISHGNHFSVMGFDYVFSQARELYKRITKACLPAAEVRTEDMGTKKQFDQYQNMIATYHRINDKETWFNEDTPHSVQSGLEHLRKSGNKARLVYGDSKTGLDWLQMDDTVGSVCRSVGPMRSPILVPLGQCAGPCILSSCIVKLIDVTKDVVIYQHPMFHQPSLRIGQDALAVEQGYPFSILKGSGNESDIAFMNFKKEINAAKAMNFLKFAHHKRM